MGLLQHTSWLTKKKPMSKVQRLHWGKKKLDSKSPLYEENNTENTIFRHLIGSTMCPKWRKNSKPFYFHLLPIDKFG
jgi:hypothetical protein